MARCFAERARVAALFALVIALSAAIACGRSKTAEPPADAAPALTLTAAVSSRLVKPGVSTQLTTRILYEARPLDRKDRPPVNLALLVDTSGSMEGRPIEDARAASLALVESLKPSDRLAIVVFHSKTEVLLPSTTIGDADLGDVKEKIRTMRARGTTDMAGGLRDAIEEVRRHLDKEGINRVILLGDGVPNDSSPVVALAQTAGASGISITSLGLGADYDETLMGKVAQVSGGRFHYVADSTKVAGFFQDEIVRLQKVYARNAALVLTPGPGVTIDAVVGQEITREGASVRVNVGDVSLGDKRDFIVRLSTTPNARDGASVELMDAELRFTSAAGATSGEKGVFVGAHTSADEAKIAASKDDEVIKAAAKAQAAADTLEQIRRSRESDRPRAPTGTQPRTGALAPANLPEPAPAQAFDSMSPARRMQAHDEAMQTLQTAR